MPYDRVQPIILLKYSKVAPTRIGFPTELPVHEDDIPILIAQVGSQNKRYLSACSCQIVVIVYYSAQSLCNNCEFIICQRVTSGFHLPLFLEFLSVY